MLYKCEGLDGEQLCRRAVDPSSLSLLGLVRHMADVERSWFRIRFARQELQPIFFTRTNQDGDFDDTDPARAEADFATYLTECRLADEDARGHSLDETFDLRDKTFNLRWIYLHMIEEYARHNGHADLLRERIDGTTGA